MRHKVKKNGAIKKKEKLRRRMKKCQTHLVFKELGYESGYLKRGAGNGVQSHNWMFVPGQFFRANYQRMGWIAGTTLWRWKQWEH